METPLSQHPFYLIFKVGVKIQHLGLKLEQEVDLSLTQWSILKRLLNQPASSAQALAEGVGIQPATLTQALKRLEKKGFIYLGKDSADSRRKVLAVARPGKDALELADQWLNNKTQELNLTPQQVQILWEKLQSIEL